MRGWWWFQKKRFCIFSAVGLNAGRGCEMEEKEAIIKIQMTWKQICIISFMMREDEESKKSKVMRELEFKKIHLWVHFFSLR